MTPLALIACRSHGASSHGRPGSRAGSHRPHYDIPLIVDAYQRGVIKLDELVSATYPLEDWESCVHDLHEGKLLRGVLNVTEA